MSLVVDNIWNEMKNIGNSKARVRALKKVNRLLSGSKGPITKAQRSTRSNIRPNQPIEARNGHVLGPNALRPPNFTSTSNTGQEGYRGQTLTTETGSSAAGALLCGVSKVYSRQDLKSFLLFLSSPKILQYFMYNY